MLRAWTSEYLFGVAAAAVRDVLATGALTGLVETGEALARGVALVGGVSDRSEVCDLRDRSEVRGSRPAVSRGD